MKGKDFLMGADIVDDEWLGEAFAKGDVSSECVKLYLKGYGGLFVKAGFTYSYDIGACGE